MALSARNRGQGTEDIEYTTDQEVWFVTGADSIGLAERKVPISGSRSAPSAARRRLSLSTTRSRGSLKVMVEV